MKFRVISLVSFILLLFIFVIAREQQKPDWKGKIEDENGVRVLRNPEDPLYGEITFELEEDLSIGNEEDENYLFFRVSDIEIDDYGNIYIVDSGNYRVQKFDKNGKYLQTIGKRGKGPGEYDRPFFLQIDNTSGNIYVADIMGRNIVIFDKDGNYLNKDIHIYEVLVDFRLDSDGNVWGKFQWIGTSTFKKLNSKGEITKELAEFSYEITQKNLKSEKVGDRIYSSALSVIHGYEHDLFISKIDNLGLVFGYSKEYKINIIDKEGRELFRITKDEPYKKFTTEEKTRIEYEVKSEGAKQGHAVNDISLKFPKHMPFFYSLLTDSRGRIYAQKMHGIRKKGGMGIWDVFCEDGYYLYRAKIPRFPYVIKNSYLYSRIIVEDTGEEFIKRYKIKNWNQIKEWI